MLSECLFPHEDKHLGWAEEAQVWLSCHPAANLVGCGRAQLIDMIFPATPSLQVLNLFIALLLNSFSADNLTPPEDAEGCLFLKAPVARATHVGPSTVSKKTLPGDTGL